MWAHAVGFEGWGLLGGSIKTLSEEGWGKKKKKNIHPGVMVRTMSPSGEDLENGVSAPTNNRGKILTKCQARKKQRKSLRKGKNPFKRGDRGGPT